MFPQKNGDFETMVNLKQCFHRKMVIFTFFTLKDLSLIMNLTKFFAWKNIKTCLRGKIEGLNKEADCY